MMNKHKTFLILGGGTAGWMAANLLAKSLNTKEAIARSGNNHRVCLVESPDIGIIGVGEGSTPQLCSLFKYLDIPESLWMPRCNASFKTGISFVGWSSKPGYEEYFHPFPAKTDRDTVQAFVYNAYLRRHGYNVDAHPDHYFLPSFLAKDKLGPHANENFPFDVSYGYHFDSHLLGEVLKDNAVAMGVKHIQANIRQVSQSDSGDIVSVICDQGREYQADYFVDCSGFSAMLIEKTLNIPFDDFSDNLFNDSAVVMPTKPKSDLNSHTTATALSAGWAWDIPLKNRTGNGYVYSSKYISRDQAEVELRTHLGVGEADKVDARHLTMKVGQRRQHWAVNCLAVGLSQGFIEPLEATALHLAQETIQQFIEHYLNGKLAQADKQNFNDSIRGRFNGVRDYIVCHYKMNSRNDSQYWRDNAANEYCSDSLSSLLKVWNKGEDLSLEIDRQNIAQYYSVVSWHCLLAGYGQFPSANPLLHNDPKSQRYPVESIQEFNRRCALNYKPHLKQLSAHK